MFMMAFLLKVLMAPKDIIICNSHKAFVMADTCQALAQRPLKWLIANTNCHLFFTKNNNVLPWQCVDGFFPS